MDGEPNRRPAVVVMIKAAEPFDEARNQRFLGRSVKKRFVPSEFRGKVCGVLLYQCCLQCPLALDVVHAGAFTDAGFSCRTLHSERTNTFLNDDGFRRIEDGLSGFYCFITGHLGKKCTEENP